MKGIPLLLFILMACSSSTVRRFSEGPVILRDEGDFRPLTEKPSEYRAATIWDGVDETLLRPLPRVFQFQSGSRALNVNALDEVPDSSWWTNRKKATSLETKDIEQGACSVPLDPKGPFEVLSAKPDGFNPGFLVKAPNGKRYFFKFDQHELQPERMSSAEVIGSLIYHSIGFTVPCYEVLYFDRSVLQLSKNATMKNKRGEKIPMTESVIDDSFKHVKKTADGKVRAVSSLLLEGAPLGPWRYAGTVSDDPNDVIPHEHRREVRAGYVLASWISHFDTRDQNTLSTWIETEDKKQGYVRHNILDFGDSIGNLADDDDISRRLGYAHYLDLPYFVEDFFTFGLVKRVWDKVEYGPAGPALGYFNTEDFVPDMWRPGYPNPAFHQMQEADAAWMARLISDFTDTHVRAIVAKAMIQNDILKKEIISILIGRRDKLLRRWFEKLSPLSEPEIRVYEKEGHLCLRDLVTSSKLVPLSDRKYEASELPLEGGVGKTLKIVAFDREYKICTPLPPAMASAARYAIIQFKGQTQGTSGERPLQVHLYKEKEQWTIAGLERLE